MFIIKNKTMAKMCFEKIEETIEQINDDKKFIDSLTTILDLWRSNSTDEKVLAHSLNLYTQFSFKNGKYDFIECDDNCASTKNIIFINSIGSFCPVCGGILPF